ncbi:MAG: hypothetical protein ACRCVU_05555 [Flavobacterium sp.]
MTKNYILKPFEIIQERNLFSIGTCILIIASIIAFMTNSRFDGVIDMHVTTSVQWYQPLLDNVINTVCLTLFLYLLSLLQPIKARIIDLVNVALISRIPIYTTLVTNIGGYNQETSDYLIANLSNPFALKELPVINLIMLALGGILALVALVLMGILLYKGYKNATNAKKVSHLLLLIPVVILAEIISKLIVYKY